MVRYGVTAKQSTGQQTHRVCDVIGWRRSAVQFGRLVTVAKEADISASSGQPRGHRKPPRGDRSIIVSGGPRPMPHLQLDRGRDQPVLGGPNREEKPRGDEDKPRRV